MRLHHVQVACPAGGEDVARRFWVDGLGLREVPKPAALAGRGGAWFRDLGPRGEVRAEVHVGIEEPFVPARKAHPALLLDDVAQLDATGERLAWLGHEVDDSERDTFPGFVRLHVRDGHGNRVELLAELPAELRGGRVAAALSETAQDDPSSEAGGTPPEGPTWSVSGEGDVTRGAAACPRNADVRGPRHAPVRTTRSRPQVTVE